LGPKDQRGIGLGRSLRIFGNFSDDSCVASWLTAGGCANADGRNRLIRLRLLRATAYQLDRRHRRALLTAAAMSVLGGFRAIK
jgi:hypothetical protein